MYLLHHITCREDICINRAVWDKSVFILLRWCMAVISILMMGGAVVYGAWDGIRNGFGFGQFFARFLIMLWGLKAYDILFFDAFLLCRSNFFTHFYPETKPVLGPHLFGYNKKTHLVHIVAMLIGSAVLGWVCTLLQ